MAKYPNSINNAFLEKQSLIILGLTGRTGSGCSTVSKILNKESFYDLDVHDQKTYDFQSRDERKYEIFYKFMSVDGRWAPFTIIEGSSIIFSFIIESGFETFCNFFAKRKSVNEKNDVRISAYSDLEATISGMKYMFDSEKPYDLSNLDEILKDTVLVEAYYNFYINELPKLKQAFARAISEFTCHREFSKSHLYTYFMQEVGNNIRSSGTPYSNIYTEQNFYDVAKRIGNIIEIVKQYNFNQKILQTRICIDAIRNPYEAYYFKDKYSSFYLVSINTEENDRKNRLGKLDEDEIKSLDEIEYEQNSSDDYEIFFHQNMQECLSISDIHLYNPQSKDGKYYFLTEQIIKYVSLMIHPGLVSPTQIERCMQTAFVARLNSGCLSRRVGAVITGDDYSIKAVGWNEVPEGQIPCNLRCISDYCANRDIETYSSFELENREFQNTLFAINKEVSKQDLKGTSYSYCFKDIYNALKESKNQVFTRSLHAEENAFLQLTKNGGQGIKGGKLFTTASPCELCAKKAFQLGVQDIYYIDPYPGISIQHILSFGTKFSPKMHLFYGAIGDAYMKLYASRMPVKDELKLLTGIDCRKVITELKNGPDLMLGVQDIKYVSQRCQFTFKSRTDICEITDTVIEALHDGIKEIPQKAYWTGSWFNGFKVNKCDRAYTFRNIEGLRLPYSSVITFNDALKKNEKVRIELQIDAKDAQQVMSPYYAQCVSIKTDQLFIEVQAPEDTITGVEFVIYADNNMSKNLEVERKAILSVKKDGVETYSCAVEHPNLMYSYSIEWVFLNK